jgi:hypothetical protein
MNSKPIEGLKCPSCKKPVVVVKETFTADVSLDKSDRAKIDRIIAQLGEKMADESYGVNTAADVCGILLPILEANIKTAPVRERMVAIHASEQTEGQRLVTTGSPAHIRRLKTVLGLNCASPETDTPVTRLAKTLRGETGFSSTTLEGVI